MEDLFGATALLAEQVPTGSCKCHLPRLQGLPAVVAKQLPHVLRQSGLGAECLGRAESRGSTFQKWEART